MTNAATRAPIALFVFRRPDHTRRTLLTLVECDGYEESPLFVFCDGARNSEERDAVDATRKTVHEIVGTRATIFESHKNQGLAASIVSGVNHVLSKHDQVIVVEDDLTLHRRFLTFLNEGLQQYSSEERVMQVSGYRFPSTRIDNAMANQEAFFLPFTVSWGWATWKRAWEHFDILATGWQKQSDSLVTRLAFDLDGTMEYSTMLDDQLDGRIDSWAIRWYWSVFKRNGLVLFPPDSLVENIGFDGTGTHGSQLARRLGVASKIDDFACQFPQSIEIDEIRFQEVKRHFQLHSGTKALRYLRRLSRRASALLRQLRA